jgi:hypothetical protein
VDGAGLRGEQAAYGGKQVIQSGFAAAGKESVESGDKVCHSSVDGSADCLVALSPLTPPFGRQCSGGGASRTLQQGYGGDFIPQPPQTINLGSRVLT